MKIKIIKEVKNLLKKIYWSNLNYKIFYKINFFKIELAFYKIRILKSLKTKALISIIIIFKKIRGLEFLKN